MFDGPREFFVETVLARCDAFLASLKTTKSGMSKDLNLGIEAAGALFHMREHLPPSVALTRAEIERACPDYGLVGDAFNAYKHHTLDHGSPRIGSAADIVELVVLTQFEDENGPYFVSSKTITLSLVDRSERELPDVVVNVLNYWIGVLKRAGIVSCRIRSTPPLDTTRQSARGTARVDQALIKGEAKKLRYKMMRYDSSLGKAVPMDLTGAKIQYNVYKPRVAIKLEIKTATGDTEAIELFMTEDQYEEFSRLSSDYERSAFVCCMANTSSEFHTVSKRMLGQQVKVNPETPFSTVSEEETREPADESPPATTE